MPRAIFNYDMVRLRSLNRRMPKKTEDWVIREYKAMIERLNSDKNVQFTLAPESVLRSVLHALESKAPKNHYRVTFPTKLFGILCRILPSSWMDNILSRADKGDKD